jgi:hypothetical protein
MIADGGGCVTGCRSHRAWASHNPVILTHVKGVIHEGIKTKIK